MRALEHLSQILPPLPTPSLSLPLTQTNPQAVLASVPDLECGFSRDLFIQWASNPRNSIILTSRPAPGCLARQLIDNLKVRSLDMEIRKRVPLEGEELETFLVKQKEGKLAAEAAKKCVPPTSLSFRNNCAQ